MPRISIITTRLKLKDNLEVSFTGNYLPEIPAVHYLSNGDPGHPAEPAEFEITKVEVVEGEVVEFVDWCNDQVHKAVAGDPDDIWTTLTNLCIENIQSSGV